MLDVAYDLRGPRTGTPLVLLHAFPLNSQMWHAVLAQLPQRRIVLIDAPGFGASPPPHGDPDLGRIADSVAAVLDTIGAPRAVVAGLSMGGYVALAMLERHRDRIAGLGLLDTKATADPPAVLARRRSVAANVLTEGLSVVQPMAQSLLAPANRAKASLVTAASAMISAGDPRAVAWASLAMAARPDRSGLLNGWNRPAAVVVGEFDEPTPPADAQAMAQALGVEPVIVAGAGHLTAMEAPATVAKILAELTDTSAR